MVVANILTHAIEPFGVSPEEYENSTRYEHHFAKIISQELGLPVIHYYITESKEIIYSDHMWGHPMIGCPLSIPPYLYKKAGVGRSVSQSMIKLIQDNKNIDVLHIHSYDILQHDLLALKFRNKIIISHGHGNPGTSWFELLITKYILANISDSVIVQSKRESRRKLLWWIDQSKIFLIPPGADNKIFRKMDKRYAKAKVDLEDEKFYLLFVGRLEAQKGVFELLKAMKIVNDKLRGTQNHHLLILGKGLQETEVKLKKLASDLQLTNVSFLGFVNHSILPYYLNASDIFVAPTWHENLAKMNIEAMMCGLPVISTNCSGVVDIIDDKKSGILIPPRDYKRLAEAIINLINNDELRNQLGKTAEKRAKSNFTWEQTAEKLKLVYSRLGIL